MGYHKLFKKIGSKRLRAIASLSMLLTLVAGNLPIAYAAGPTISITSPTNNTVQQGIVQLTATAGPDTLGVTFKVTGPGIPATTFPEDTTAPYDTQWDSTVWNPPTTLHINKADYTITAVARGTGGTTNSTPVKVKLNNSPVNNKVMVVGDSVTQQAFDPNADGTDTYSASAPASTDLLLFKKMGWSTKDIQTTVNNYSIFRQPKKLVVAMGLNDAGVFFSDGWNPDDLERFRTLINTTHADSCVALVLPGHGATGDTPWFNSWATEIDQARADLAQLATERPHTITVDWQTVIDQHPEYVDNDGVHLPTPNKTWQEDLDAASRQQMNPVDPAAAEARQEFYWNAATQCEAPSATFQTPENNATIEGTVPLTVNATGAASVQFQVDGQNIGSPVTSAPYQIDWDSTTMPDSTDTTNGTHTLTAVSTNPSGTHTASTTVNVQNPLPVELVGENGAKVEGIVPLQVNVAGSPSVQFQVDGQNVGDPVTQAPYQIDWDTTTMPDGTPTTNGNHTITAVSTKPSGTTHLATRTVNIQNPPVPGSVGLIGDSVTFNSLNSTGIWYEQTFFGNKPQNLLHSYWPGAAHPNSQGAIQQWAANRTPEILIDAYGFNDARPAYPISPYWAGDGFSDVDRADVLAALNTVHASSCKVLVLPGWGSGLGYVPPDDNPSDDAAILGWELEYIQELQEVRAFYNELATQRNDIVIVDWQPIINEHPEYMSDDGVHLASKTDGSAGWRTDAAEARQAMYWNGVAQCQAMLASQ